MKNIETCFFLPFLLLFSFLTINFALKIAQKDYDNTSDS